MSVITITGALTIGYDIVTCDDTSEIKAGMRISGGNLSDTAIVMSIDEDSSLTISEAAIQDGVIEFTLYMPSDTEIIELEILRQLRKSITDYVVELFPNDPSTYILTHPNGAVLIHYESSPFSAPGDVGRYGQKRELTYQITVLGRNLRNNLGIQKQMELVRDALTGIIPYGCSEGMYQSDESFLAEYAGEWHYAMWFKANSVYDYK